MLKIKIKSKNTMYLSSKASLGSKVVQSLRGQAQEPKACAIYEGGAIYECAIYE